MLIFTELNVSPPPPFLHILQWHNYIFGFSHTWLIFYSKEASTGRGGVLIGSNEKVYRGTFEPCNSCINFYGSYGGSLVSTCIGCGLDTPTVVITWFQHKSRGKCQSYIIYTYTRTLLSLRCKLMYIIQNAHLYGSTLLNAWLFLSK